MVSAAKGAEDFYSIEHHASRKEGIEEAKDRDTAAARVSNFTILVIFGPKSKVYCEIFFPSFNIGLGWPSLPGHCG